MRAVSIIGKSNVYLSPCRVSKQPITGIRRDSTNPKAHERWNQGNEDGDLGCDSADIMTSSSEEQQQRQQQAAEVVHVQTNPLEAIEGDANTEDDLVLAAASAAQTRRPTTILYTKSGSATTRILDKYPWEPPRSSTNVDEDEEYVHPSLENRK